VEFRLDALGLGVRRLVLLQRLIANLDHQAGVIVSTVAKNSAADNAGLRDKDIITHLNGVATPDIDTFRAVLAEKLADNPELIEISVARGKTTFETALLPDYDLKGQLVGAYFGDQPPEFADLMKMELVASGCRWHELTDWLKPNAPSAKADILLLASKPGTTPGNPALAGLIKDAMKDKRVVAASGPAVIHVLNSGSELTDRKITLSKESTEHIKPGAVQYTGQEVEEDGKLVTSTGRDRKVVRDFIKAVRKAAASQPEKG
jgi:hypothetical protein